MFTDKVISTFMVNVIPLVTAALTLVVVVTLVAVVVLSFRK